MLPIVCFKVRHFGNREFKIGMHLDTENSSIDVCCEIEVSSLLDNEFMLFLVPTRFSIILDILAYVEGLELNVDTVSPFFSRTNPRKLKYTEFLKSSGPGVFALRKFMKSFLLFFTEYGLPALSYFYLLNTFESNFLLVAFQPKIFLCAFERP